MPRGKRKSLDEKLAALDADKIKLEQEKQEAIASFDQKFAELEERKKELLKEKEDAQLDTLRKVMGMSGVTASDLIKMIEERKGA